MVWINVIIWVLDPNWCGTGTLCEMLLRPYKKSPVSGHRSGSKSVRWHMCFFLPTSGIRDTCICGYWNQTKFPIHKVWWLREASQIGQTFIPLCGKSHLKHSTAEFQSILAAIGHRFIIIAKKLKMPTLRSEAMCVETRDFFVGPDKN